MMPAGELARTTGVDILASLGRAGKCLRWRFCLLEEGQADMLEPGETLLAAFSRGTSAICSLNKWTGDVLYDIWMATGICK